MYLTSWTEYLVFFVCQEDRWPPHSFSPLLYRYLLLSLSVLSAQKTIVICKFLPELAPLFPAPGTKFITFLHLYQNREHQLCSRATIERGGKSKIKKGITTYKATRSDQQHTQFVPCLLWAVAARPTCASNARHCTLNKFLLPLFSEGRPGTLLNSSRHRREEPTNNHFSATPRLTLPPRRSWQGKQNVFQSQVNKQYHQTTVTLVCSTYRLVLPRQIDEAEFFPPVSSRLLAPTFAGNFEPLHLSSFPETRISLTYKNH